MADRPAKRARATSNSETTHTITDPVRLTDLFTSIQSLDEATVRSLLFTAASESPAIAGQIEIKVAIIKKAESNVVRDFSHFSKSVWYTLNKEYSRLKSSRQFEVAGEAFNSIVSNIERIKDQCPAHASYGTKSGGVEALRKIGKVICMSAGDELIHRVQQSFQQSSILEDTMRSIVETMSAEDRADLSQEPQGEGVFLDKLHELQELASDLCLFENLEEVIRLLEDENAGSGGEDEGAVQVVDLTL